MTILQDINLYMFFSKALLKLKKKYRIIKIKKAVLENCNVSIKKIRSEYYLSNSSYLTGHVFRKSFFKCS